MKNLRKITTKALRRYQFVNSEKYTHLQLKLTVKRMIEDNLKSLFYSPKVLIPQKTKSYTKKTTTETGEYSIKIGTGFSGLGCPEHVLGQLGIKHSSEFVIDINKFCRETLIKNYNPKKVFDDITSVRGRYLRHIDLYVWGSPCQDLSKSNTYREGLKGGKSKLFFEGYRLLKEIRPKYSIFENVEGLLSSNNEEDFKTVMKLFKELDYKVYYKVINPVKIGGNTTRKRVFVILIRNDIEIEYNFPKEIKRNPKCIKDCLITDVEHTYIDKSEYIKHTKSIKEQRGYLRKVYKYLLGSRDELKRVYSIDHKCPTIQRNGKILIYDGIGVRYLLKEELKTLQGFGNDLDLSHLSPTQYKSQLGNTMEVETMKKLLSEIVRIDKLHKQNKRSNRGRKPMKVKIIDNHISLTKNTCNLPDLNYINAKPEIGKEYKTHLKNGGTITLTFNKFKNKEDKKNDVIETKFVVQIKGLKKLGRRTNTQDRYKIIGSKDVVEKVRKHNVLIVRPGGKNKFETQIDNALNLMNIKERKLPVVVDSFFGGGGITLKHIEKLKFDRYIINDLEPLIYKTMLAVKKDYQKVMKIYQKINKRYFRLVNNPNPTLKGQIPPHKELYTSIGQQLNNHKDLDLYTVGGYFLFFNSRSYCGILEYDSNGDINVKSCNNSTTLNDKSYMIKHWSYLLNLYNVEIENKDVFELLNDSSISKKGLIFSDSPYIDREDNQKTLNYDFDNSVKFQKRLQHTLNEFENIIYCNEHCKRLYDLELNTGLDGFMIFPRKSFIAATTNKTHCEFLGYRTNKTILNNQTSINTTTYQPNIKSAA